MALLFNLSTFLGNSVKNCIFKIKISIFLLFLLKKMRKPSEFSKFFEKKVMEGILGLKGTK